MALSVHSTSMLNQSDSGTAAESVCQQNQFEAHPDRYTCIGINLNHLTEDDKHTLDCHLPNSMVMERETGWFVKLYQPDIAASVEEFYTAKYPGITLNLLKIFCGAYRAGFRLIEFDLHAQEVCGLSLFDED